MPIMDRGSLRVLPWQQEEALVGSLQEILAKVFTPLKISFQFISCQFLLSLFLF